MLKVSIIIPIYNVQEYLEECLNSVINQTFKDIEIILVDDCGTDNSMQIAKDFAKKDSRIKIIHHKKNKGLGPSRNTGLDYASGKYIFFLDSDDYLKENAIEELVKSSIKNHVDIVTTRTLAFADDNSEDTLLRTQEKNNWLEKLSIDKYQVYYNNFSQALGFNCTSWGKLYTRSFIESNNLRFINGNYIHEDEGFWIKTCASFPSITYIENIGLMYRIRKNAITADIDKRKNKHKKYRHFRQVLRDALEYIDKNVAKELGQFLKSKIINSPAYLSYICLELPILLKYSWLKNDKIINVLGLPLFREKVGRNNKKRGRILGIPIYKTNIKSIHLKNPLKKLNIRKGAIKLTTCNQDKNILDSIKDLQDFYFLPNKGNLGDIVIAASEFQYFDAHNMNYKVYEIEKEYSEPFNFVYGGGGIWHKLYQKDYQEIIDIFRSPMLKKCVVLPSSFYDSEDVIKAFDERFTVFCREKQSFEYCKSLNNKAKFILADDMVIGADFDIFKKKFIDSKNFKNFKKLDSCYDSVYFYYYVSLKKALCGLKQTEKNIGYLFRTDKESVNKTDKVQTIDPSSFAGGFGCDKGLDFLLAKIFLATINSFDIVVTDRLHIGICAAKLGKQTLLLDNSYKKLSEVYKNSLYKFENVKLTTSETLEQDIKNIKLQKNKKTDLFETLPVNFDDFLVQYGSFENEYGAERNFW